MSIKPSADKILQLCRAIPAKTENSNCPENTDTKPSACLRHTLNSIHGHTAP